MGQWRCGDCGTAYPKNVHRCTRSLDDYLSLRGGSVESAIHRAVEKAITPLVDAAYRRMVPGIRVRWLSGRQVPVLRIDYPDFPLAA